MSFDVGDLIIRRFSRRVGIILTEPVLDRNCLVYYIFQDGEQSNIELFITQSLPYGTLQHYEN